MKNLFICNYHKVQEFQNNVKLIISIIIIINKYTLIKIKYALFILILFNKILIF